MLEMHSDAQGAVVAEEGEVPNYSALFIPELAERIISHMDFETLKVVRLLNHFWFSASRSTWAKKTKIQVKTLQDITNVLSQTVNLRKELPYTVENWIFQGETMPLLMCDEGICQRNLMDQFWSSIKSIEYSNWVVCRCKKSGRWVLVRHEDGRRRWHYRVRTVRYEYCQVQKGSIFQIANMFKVCPNLTHLKLNYPILPKMKGTYMGPRMFPQLPNLARLEVFGEWKRWDPTLSPDNPERVLFANLARADEGALVPVERSGGTNLILRIFDHSPNLIKISFNLETIMSKTPESWFVGLLFAKTVHLNLMDLQCSIPVNQEICQTLQSKNWGLRSLHLKIMQVLGLSSNFPAYVLYDMIASFRDTLEHLELIFYDKGSYSAREFFSAEMLYNLRSLEIWGFVGSFDFLKKLKRLRKLVVGVTDLADYERIQDYLQDNPIDGLTWELKNVAEFHQRLDQGPISPFKI